MAPRRRKKAPAAKTITREEIQALNQSVIDQQCLFLSKLNRSISKKLKGKKVRLNDSENQKIDAVVQHAYIEGDRLVVLDVLFGDKRVLVDYTYLAEK